TYLDRSWDVTIRDTVVLRGTPQPYTDEIASDGGVADLRLAAATRLRSWLAVGAGIHFLSGSTRMSASRRFDDSASYQRLQQSEEVSYDGLGVSGSLLLDLTRAVRVGARALPARRPRGTAPVRARRHGAHGVRDRSRHRPRLRGGPGSPRRRYRAPPAFGGRARGARVDLPHGPNHPAVNVYFHTFGCK